MHYIALINQSTSRAAEPAGCRRGRRRTDGRWRHGAVAPVPRDAAAVAGALCRRSVQRRTLWSGQQVAPGAQLGMRWSCLLASACACLLISAPHSPSFGLQTKSTPPIPALRLLLVVSLLALGTLLALDALALAAALARQAWRRCCSPLQQQRRQRNAAADGSLDIETGSAAGSKAGSEGKAEAPAEVYSATDGNKGAAANEGANHASSGAAAAEEAVQRPDIPLKRGLSRRLVGFEARHPRSASACCCCRVACALRLLL